VAFLHTTLPRFFALSLAIHILALLILKAPPMNRSTDQEAIPVTLAPQSERESAPITRTPRAAPATRAAKIPAVIAKKDSAVVGKQALSPVRENPAPVEKTRAEPPPVVQEAIAEKTVVAERTLPAVKDLLPSANFSTANGRANAPISLNTKDPTYVNYFTKIKQSIEVQWEYPEMALRYGLQGRLALEFTIGANGQLEYLRVVRSSGSELLDQEAVRAIRAAAPFPPIPVWLKPVPLSISAAMEYHDNRLNYRFTR
jgi:protein TonB